jgi:Transglycosylase SLT domain
MPSFLSKKRSRLITMAAAGTLSVATVATAVAATLPSAAAAASAPADTHLTVVTTQHETSQAGHGDAMTAAQRLAGFDRVRFSLGERQHEHDVAVAKAAAAKQAKLRSAGTPSGSPQHIAAQLLTRYGWSSGQMSCLYPLWYHESDWNPSAENSSSGAYGIPQSLPGAQMASAGADWQTNPATQIKWGLTYIQGRYGSPCGAWAHEQANNWY